jgi:anaerobic magnesium-protoporphyrin IX monomethyl ester cyclase
MVSLCVWGDFLGLKNFKISVMSGARSTKSCTLGENGILLRKIQIKGSIMVEKLNFAMVLPPNVAFPELVERYEENIVPTKVYPLSLPLGALHLLSVIDEIEETNFVSTLDYNLEYRENHRHISLDDYIDSIAENLDFIPDVIGFSLIFSVTHGFFDRCADRLKERWPDAKIIVGGTHATNCPREILENENVDFLVRGEAELSLPLLLKSISERIDPESISINGVYTKKSYEENQFFLRIGDYPDLDQLPLPGWRFVSMDRYASATERGKRGINAENILYEKRIGTFMSTRGCPYKCTFCSSHTVHGRKMRYFSIDRTVEMIQTLHDEYGINTFVVEDDLFTVRRDRTVELCKTLRELNIPNFELQVPNALSINTLNEEVVDELCRTGMEVVNLAIESGSEYVQRHIIEKNVDLEKAKEIVKLFRDRNVITRCFFILGSPKETKEQMLESVDYARELGADWCTFNPVLPLVGTKGYQQFLDLGYIEDDPVFWSESAFGRRMFDTEEIGGEELTDLTYRANLDVNFVNNINLQNGGFQRALSMISEIVTDYPFHIIGLYCMALCHDGLGQIDLKNELLDKIQDVASSDARASEMLKNYGHVIPELLTHCTASETGMSGDTQFPKPIAV